jgi:peroxiredoxin Q/BCP
MIKTLVLTALCLFLAPFASQSLAVEVGEKAPDFELDSTTGGKLKLSSLRGRNVVIQFYVLDYSPG